MLTKNVLLVPPGSCSPIKAFLYNHEEIQVSQNLTLNTNAPATGEGLGKTLTAVKSRGWFKWQEETGPSRVSPAHFLLKIFQRPCFLELWKETNDYHEKWNILLCKSLPEGLVCLQHLGNGQAGVSFSTAWRSDQDQFTVHVFSIGKHAKYLSKSSVTWKALWRILPGEDNGSSAILDTWKNHLLQPVVQPYKDLIWGPEENICGLQFGLNKGNQWITIIASLFQFGVPSHFYVQFLPGIKKTNYSSCQLMLETDIDPLNEGQSWFGKGRSLPPPLPSKERENSNFSLKDSVEQASLSGGLLP